MKKKISILLALILFVSAIAVTIVIIPKKPDNKIRVTEVTRSIFYAPLYAALNLGYFEDEGLDVEITTAGGSNYSMNAILSGEADIGLMGPETVVYVADGESTDQPKIFGQLTKRDGSFLISKTNITNFQWTDTIGKTIIGGRRGGMPAMTLRYIIEVIHGLEIGEGPDKVNLRDDVAFDLVGSTYESTDAEFCTMFEPLASKMQNENKGHIVASVGLESGEIPYTAFIAKTSYMEKNPDKIKAFLRAVIRGYRFLTTATLDQFVDALAPSFTSATRQEIIDSIARYVESDCWMSTPVMKESSYNRLLEVIMHAGELDAPIPFETVVENKYAIEVINELNAA